MYIKFFKTVDIWEQHLYNPPAIRKRYANVGDRRPQGGRRMHLQQRRYFFQNPTHMITVLIGLGYLARRAKFFRSGEVRLWGDVTVLDRACESLTRVRSRRSKQNILRSRQYGHMISFHKERGMTHWVEGIYQMALHDFAQHIVFLEIDIHRDTYVSIGFDSPEVAERFAAKANCHTTTMTQYRRYQGYDDRPASQAVA